MESLEEFPKKIQYMNIDSHFIDGTTNTFSVNLGITSNTFVQEMRDVIGIKVVDFYVTQVGVNSAGTADAAKYLDIICDDVPTAGQMLDERKGRILSRIPIERNFGGGTNIVLHDKQWRSFTRKTNYFNPISIKKLNFEIYQLEGDDDYNLLKSNTNWFFTLEITTIDHKAPPKDTNLRVVRAVEKLCKKVDKLNENVIRIPEPEPKKKIPLRYVFIPIIAFLVMYYMKPKSQPAPAPIMMHRPPM